MAKIAFAYWDIELSIGCSTTILKQFWIQKRLQSDFTSISNSEKKYSKDSNATETEKHNKSDSNRRHFSHSSSNWKPTHIFNLPFRVHINQKRYPLTINKKWLHQFHRSNKLISTKGDNEQKVKCLGNLLSGLHCLFVKNKQLVRSISSSMYSTVHYAKTSMRCSCQRRHTHKKKNRE